jgi:serine/threonine-protein kinase RsbW
MKFAKTKTITAPTTFAKTIARVSSSLVRSCSARPVRAADGPSHARGPLLWLGEAILRAYSQRGGVSAAVSWNREFMASADGSVVNLELEPAPDSVGAARHAVADLAERSGADTDAVAVAVSEVVTNAVLHAFKEAGDGTIELHARLNGKSLLIVVADDGSGIRPNPGSPGLGYGLALVASLTDELGIAASPQGGTSVSMRFALAG